jgi:hypothetical protein
VANLVIPPLLLYAFGVILITLGGLRAYYLGWLKRPETVDEGGADAGDEAEGAAEALDREVEPVETARKPGGWSRGGGASGHKRHLLMGLLYVMMGLFIVISTVLNSRG